MRSLRAKLFLSVGAILLIVALINYLLPEILLRKDLNQAAVQLKEHFNDIEKRMLDVSSFAISYRVVESAAQLGGLAEIISLAPQDESASALALAARIAAYHPLIAFVQVGSTVVAPEDGRLYSPERAPFEEGMLWVKIPERDQIVVAVPTDQPDLYLLFDKPSAPLSAQQQWEESAQASFSPFISEKISFSTKESIQTLFQTLLWNETQWVNKIDMIQKLEPWQGKQGAPIGSLKTDQQGHGVCILAEEVFLQEPIIENIEASDSLIPSLLLREGVHGRDFDMVRVISLPNQKWLIGIGFSIASIVKKIAQVIQKPIIVTQDGTLSLGFTPNGQEIDPSKTGLVLQDIQGDHDAFVWEGKTYFPYQIQVHQLNLIILTPEEQAIALMRFLNTLRDETSKEISISLMAAALASLGIALLLLSNISKTITRPIAELSHAFEELGKGKYEGLVLPRLGNRKDEIAVLTHSFSDMVSALRDRDKIRGVLNKVVSKEISEEILQHDIELGGEERLLTLLFSDIRGFTHLSESLPPKELVGFVNDYMTRMCRIIDETGGVVDKFVGDEIMALYGAPLALEQHAVRAIEAALLMVQYLKRWNAERASTKEPHFEVGIGIHTGVACTGNVGAENRLNYTAIGANVNLASRLCGLAHPMQILISEETWKFPGVQQRFCCQALPPAQVKGIDHPIPVYEVVGFHRVEA